MGALGGVKWLASWVKCRIGTKNIVMCCAVLFPKEKRWRTQKVSKGTGKKRQKKWKKSRRWCKCQVYYFCCRLCARSVKVKWLLHFFNDFFDGTKTFGGGATTSNSKVTSYTRNKMVLKSRPRQLQVRNTGMHYQDFALLGIYALCYDLWNRSNRITQFSGCGQTFKPPCVFSSPFTTLATTKANSSI